MQGRATLGGNPIHPMLVPFPIGFFVGALVCDIISRWGDPAFWPRMALTLVGFGLIASLLAGIAGAIDYASAPMTDTAKRVALTHLTMILLVVAIFAVEYFVRMLDMNALPGYLLEVLGVVTLVTAMYFGGMLAHRYRIGVTAETEREVRRDRGTIEAGRRPVAR